MMEREIIGKVIGYIYMAFLCLPLGSSDSSTMKLIFIQTAIDSGFETIVS